MCASSSGTSRDSFVTISDNLRIHPRRAGVNNKLSGVWQYNDYTYTASGSGTKAAISTQGASGGQRPLSLNMIRALHKHFGIPADVLIQPVGRKRRAA
jgi:hypothetical protein